MAIAEMMPHPWTTLYQGSVLATATETISFQPAVVATRTKQAPKWKNGTSNKSFLVRLGWIKLKLGPTKSF